MNTNTVHATTDTTATNPRKRPTARSTMPSDIADTYTEVPTALWEHGSKLGLKLPDLALVAVMWSYKWYATSPIKPSMASLAQRGGVSDATVSRFVAKLERLGLLVVHRAGPSKHSPVESYDLSPLWERLAALVREARPELRVIDGGEPSVPQSAKSVPQSAKSVPQSAGRPSCNLRDEVDEVEVDEEEDEPSSPPAHTREPSDQDILTQLRRDVVDPTLFPSKKGALLRQIERYEKRARSEGGLEALRSLGLRRFDEDDEVSSEGAIDTTGFEVGAEDCEPPPSARHEPPGLTACLNCDRPVDDAVALNLQHGRCWPCFNYWQDGNEVAAS